MRIVWIDYLKVLGITLVVLGHFYSPFRTWIFTFHMPLWFLISGFLCKARGWREEMGKVWHSLLLPYLLYGVICLVADALFFVPHFSTIAVRLGDMLPQLLMGDLDSMVSRIPKPLWFLLSLAGVRLIAAFAGRYHILLALPSLLLFFVLELLRQRIAGFWSHDWMQLHSTLLAYPLFAVGIFLRRVGFAVYRWPATLNFMTGGVLSFTCLVIAWWNGAIDISLCVFYGNVWLTLICAIGISVGLMLAFASLPLPRIGWVEKLSEGTLLVLATHMIGISFFPGYLPAWKALLAAGLILALSYLLISMCLKCTKPASLRIFCRLLLGKN